MTTTATAVLSITQTLDLDQLQKRLTVLQTRMAQAERDLSDGMMVANSCGRAQGKRLVAFGLLKEAQGIMGNLVSSAMSLKPEAGGKMSLVPGVAELLMDQFDVGQDAIVPFLWESCTRFLPMAESLVDQARTCLDEASALDRDREARR